MLSHKENSIKADILTLAKCELLSESWEPILCHRLWAEQTAVIIFLRHFACAACRAHAVDVWQRREQYQSKGAKIYFVGNGQPSFIEGFKKDLSLEGANIYTDPSLASFRAAGFKRGFLAALGPKAIVNYTKLASSGNVTGYKKGAGDIWQLGGVLVVHKSGKVGYQYISEIAGDFPPESNVTIDDN